MNSPKFALRGIGTPGQRVVERLRRAGRRRGAGTKKHYSPSLRHSATLDAMERNEVPNRVGGRYYYRLAIQRVGAVVREYPV